MSGEIACIFILLVRGKCTIYATNQGTFYHKNCTNPRVFYDSNCAIARQDYVNSFREILEVFTSRFIETIL